MGACVLVSKLLCLHHSPCSPKFHPWSPHSDTTVELSKPKSFSAFITCPAMQHKFSFDYAGQPNKTFNRMIYFSSLIFYNRYSPLEIYVCHRHKKCCIQCGNNNEWPGKGKQNHFHNCFFVRFITS